MKISDILTANDVIVINNAASKRQLLKEMSIKIAEGTVIDDRSMFDIILERENLGSTAFGGGTAVPHGRIPELKQLKGLFAKLQKGIDFEADDNQPVDLVFMLVSPENSGADHLSALAQISKIIKDEEICGQLRNAGSTEEIYRILTQN